MRKLFFGLALLLAFNVGAQNVAQPRLHVLENGLRVITVEDPSMPLVSLVWSAHVGDSAEPLDFAGNSHYLEHLLLFRGTEKYPKNQIGEWSSSRGGYFNGSTWYDYTTFVLMATRGDLEEILDRHEQMMFHGNFSGQDFETEKKAVFEELRSGLDTPYGYIWRAAPYHMYPKETFYSRSTIGTIETVQAATVDRVRQYYEDYYVPNNMTLAIVGDFNTEDLMSGVRQRFGKYARSELPDSLYSPVPMKPGVTLVTEERNFGKSYFLLATEGPRAGDPEYFPYVLLGEYLAGGDTSLLHSELVIEKKLLDSVYMSAWPRRFAKGWQGIAAETEAGEVVNAIDELWKLVERVRNAGVSDDDLHFARQRLLKQHYQLLDDQYEIAENLAQADAHGDYRLFAGYEERLLEVTAADVRAVARKYLTPEKFFLMSLFPEGATPADYENTIRTNAAALDRSPGTVVSETLSSGATLLHESRQGAKIESFTVAIRAGDRYGNSSGLAEAVVTMLARESSRYSRDELQNYLDRQGFTLTASTDMDAAYINLQGPAYSTSKATELLIELLTSPGFSKAEWANTQEEMVAALRSGKDQPRIVALDALLSTMFKGTGYGRSIDERLEDLRDTTVQDIRAFWSRYYRPQALAFAYNGNASLEQISEQLGSLQSLEGRAPGVGQIDSPIIDDVVHSPRRMEGMTQANLYLGWIAPPVTSKEFVLWQLAEKAIGGDLAGRLWKLRQEEGLAYSVWLGHLANKDQPVTYVYMATAAEKRAAALAAIDREIRLAQDGLNAEELDRVKISLLANLNRLDRTAARRTQRHAQWWVRGLDANYRSWREDVVADATLEDVNRIVRDVLDADNYVFAEAGAVVEQAAN